MGGSGNAWLFFISYFLALLCGSTFSFLMHHRFDARLLLDTLPAACSDQQSFNSDPESPGGWSDLPSDSEDTFFLTLREVEDCRREKRRRLLDHNREQRLRALRAEEDEEDDAIENDVWGGSDEEV